MAKDVIFRDVKEQSYYRLENQDGGTREVDEAAVEEYLEAIFDDPDQFIILTPPKAQKGIRFIQARQDNDDRQIEVELALQVEGGIRLYYKMVSPSQCYRIFMDYFDNAFSPNMAEYQPVEFP